MMNQERVYIPSSDEEKVFAATIYGEAANCSLESWKAIASVIMNRMGKREWRRFRTISEIINFTGFDAFTDRNAPFRQAIALFTGRADPRAEIGVKLMDLCQAVLPICRGENVTTDAVLYYSPKAQAALHKKNPKKWRARPPWDFAVIEEVKVEGTENDDFKWFRYKQ